MQLPHQARGDHLSLIADSTLCCVGLRGVGVSGDHKHSEGGVACPLHEEGQVRAQLCVPSVKECIDAIVSEPGCELQYPSSVLVVVPGIGNEDSRRSGFGHFPPSGKHGLRD